jgi:hypothetical protein
MKKGPFLFGIAVTLTSVAAMPPIPNGEAATYKPQVRWVKHISENIWPYDAWIGSDGKLYEVGYGLGTPMTRMYCFDSNGHLKKWNLDGQHVIRRAGAYLAIEDANGKTHIWKDGKVVYSVGITAGTNGALALNESGNYSVIDDSGVLHTFSANGKSATFRIPGWREASLPYLFLSPDGTSYLLVIPNRYSRNKQSQMLYAIDVHGKQLWSTTVQTDVAQAAFSKDGQLYLLTAPNDTQYVISAYNKNGTIKWAYTIPDDDGWTEIEDMTVGPDGTLYVPRSNQLGTAYLTAIDSSGKEKWTTALGQKETILRLTLQPNDHLTLRLDKSLDWGSKWTGVIETELSQKNGKILWTKRSRDNGRNTWYELWDCTETKNALVIVPENNRYDHNTVNRSNGGGFYILDSAGHQKYFCNLHSNFLVQFPMAPDGTVYAVWDNSVEAFRP